MAMQNAFAGTKPHCPVRTPIKEIMALLVPATNHPCHLRRPTSTVESMVNTHET